MKKAIEVWKDIVGYEGLYRISNLGNLYSVRRGVVLKSTMGTCGYWECKLYKDGKITPFKIHRIVATHFVPGNFESATVNHINEIKTDNRAENLEWVTREANTSMSISGRRASFAVYDTTTGITYESIRKASMSLGVANRTLYDNVIRGKHPHIKLLENNLHTLTPNP